MKPSPCLHPITIKDRNGDQKKVPCGHCAACVVNKGRMRTERLEDMLSEYPFKFFSTLTYNNDWRPIAQVTPDGIYHPNDCDYNGVVYSLGYEKFTQEDFDFVLDRVQQFGGLPVVSHRDLINFKKRLRYHFNKVFPNAKLFIYGCAEYGPTTFMPHYHLLFGTDENCTTSVFEMCVRKAWSLCHKNKEGDFYEPFGFVDVKRVYGKGVCGYVARYINCVTHLPKVYQNAQWRPFANGSKSGDKQLFAISQTEVREVISQPTLYVRKLRRDKFVSVPVPSVYLSRYFPRLPKFNDLAYHELVSLYGLFDAFKGSLDQSWSHWKDLNLLRDHNYLVHPGTPFDGRDQFYFEPSMLRQLVHQLCFYDAEGNYIDDEYKNKQRFSRIYYISRRVCLNADLVCLPVRAYVDRIIDYYKKYELDKLKRFYQMQEVMMNDPYNPVPLSDIFTLYFNSDSKTFNSDYYLNQFGLSLNKVDDLPLQRKYSETCLGILKDTTKTKKANDYHFSRGRCRVPYFPHLDYRVQRFINLVKH